jgi:hypothetical protein
LIQSKSKASEAATTIITQTQQTQMDVAVTPCDILSSRSTRSMTTVESSHTGGNVLESCVRQLHYVGGKYVIEQLDVRWELFLCLSQEAQGSRQVQL